MFNKITKEFSYGNDTVVLETGMIARQATSAVMVTIGKTSVLVTVVAKKDANPDQDFFPLTVNYQEKYYAAGKIPGGFLKREGRPSEKETLTCRLIDRPIRPLFPNGFKNEVQVVATVMSADKDVDADIAAMIGTSAALAISGVPFNGPIGAARIGYKDGMYILNPSISETAESKLDLVVAGTEKAVLMVESEAKELTEDQMLGAVLFGHMEMQKVIEAITEFAAEVATPAWEWQPAEENTELKAAVEAGFGEGIKAAYQIREKMERYSKVGELKAEAIEKLAGEEEGQPSEKDVAGAFSKLEKTVVRETVLSGEPRIDGRDVKTVRPIETQVGILPQPHGTALFTRGETQAIIVATLGALKEAQMIDDITGLTYDPFMLHYNFPPYCVGETGRMGSPGRREIGHGRLARRSIEAVLPTPEEFPYTIRVVSEITESNGSSSMASVCGSSLALMDAGVPLKAPVAGIAMGLIKEGERFAVLTDILGDEDHLGDMDFKVAGTEKGVTALQMDIKIEGINEEIMEIALEQAKAGRLHILGEMAKSLTESREEVAATAPTLLKTKIPTDKIRDVIGKGGANIKALTEATGTEINIEDDGSVNIYGETRAGAKDALARIEKMTEEPIAGTVYAGKVARIEAYGAFITLPMGVDGLLHVSEIAHERVEKVTDYLAEGQDVEVKLLEVDNRGRLKLSMKALVEKPAPEDKSEA